MSKEEWKDIQGYEGLYQVSNLGRVKSLDKRIRIISKNQYKKFNVERNFKGKVLKQTLKVLITL